jgi:PKD repeat protein
MKILYTLSIILITSTLYAQELGLTKPKSFATNEQASWGLSTEKSLGDSCGAYFNNYIGLLKTSDLYFEEMRTGNGSDFNPYAGRGQRFHANQEIEISGVQFYGFFNNDLLDSIMVVTLLYDYDESIDSVGLELARDTVWVKHTAFTPLLPEIEVNSYFDIPVVVSADYIVGVYTSTNDSLKIITSSAVDNDGEGEGVSFAYYRNPVAPSYTGWYPTLPTFGPSYDLDYLISPRVKFEINPGFVMSADTICPNVDGALCVEYIAKPNFSEKHYNRNAETPNSKIGWLWDDGSQNTMLTNLCHTYTAIGDYTVTLKDTLKRYNYGDVNCAFITTEMVNVTDSAQANFSSVETGLTAVFTNASILATTYLWDFGDGNTSTAVNPTHVYDAIGNYDVTLYASGECDTDSITYTITISDVSIKENINFIKIFPNPANENLNISIAHGHEGVMVSLLNILGETVIDSKKIFKDTQFNLADLSSGTYFLKVQEGNHIEVKKIVIEH